MKEHPAPWRVVLEKGKQRFDEFTGEPKPTFDYFWIKDSANQTVTLFHGKDAAEINKANLFAAAPDLLESLENLVGQLNDGGDYLSVLKNAELVLQKARGES